MLLRPVKVVLSFCAAFLSSIALVFAQSADAVTVAGHERLAWDVVVEFPARLADLDFAMQLDEVPTTIDRLTCEPSSPSTFVCSAQLPPMTAGDHVIAISSRFLGAVPSAYSQSQQLRVRMAPGTTVLGSALRDERRAITVDGIHLTRSEVAVDIAEPSDVVALPGGRVLVGDRTGRIWIFRHDLSSGEVALSLDDCGSTSGCRLVAVAADPKFDDNRHIYVLYTASSGWRVARYALREQRFSERAIIAEGLPIFDSSAGAAMRIGVDRHLYITLGGTASDRSDAYAGRVLRLDLDGAARGAAFGPVFGIAAPDAATMTWRSRDASVWTGGESASNVILRSQSPNWRDEGHWALPQIFGTPKIAAYTNPGLPALDGDILIGSAASRGLLRVTIDEYGTLRSTEWLFSNSFGRITAIASSPEGVMYVAEPYRLIQITAR